MKQPVKKTFHCNTILRKSKSHLFPQKNNSLALSSSIKAMTKSTLLSLSSRSVVWLMTRSGKTSES